MTAEISIVVPHLNQPDRLERLLASLSLGSVLRPI
jgi:hypothetical protein